MEKPTCEMTIEYPTYPGSKMFMSYDKCGKPAKFEDTKPQMQVRYVCGIHARSIESTCKRVGKKSTLVPLTPNRKRVKDV